MRHDHVPPGAVKVDKSPKEEGEDDHNTKTDDWEHSRRHDHVHWWGLVHMVWSMGRLGPIALRRGVGQDDGRWQVLKLEWSDGPVQQPVPEDHQ